MNEAEVRNQAEKRKSQIDESCCTTDEWYRGKRDDTEDVLSRSRTRYIHGYTSSRIAPAPTAAIATNLRLPCIAMPTRVHITRTAVAADPASRGAGPVGVDPEVQTKRWEGTRPGVPAVADRQEGSRRAREDRSLQEGGRRSQARAGDLVGGSRQALGGHPEEGIAQEAGRPGVGSLAGQEAHACRQAWDRDGDRDEDRVREVRA